MDSLRKTALIAGVLYLLTFVSIPILAPVRPGAERPELHRRPRARTRRSSSAAFSR